jgi:hypothetical protein
VVEDIYRAKKEPYKPERRRENRKRNKAGELEILTQGGGKSGAKPGLGRASRVEEPNQSVLTTINQLIKMGMDPQTFFSNMEV